MFHGLTKICAHVKYSCGSILTQIHPVMIFLTPRQSIPKCPEGFPNSFLTYWKTDREVLYGKSMHFEVLTKSWICLFRFPRHLSILCFLEEHGNDSQSKLFCWYMSSLNFSDMKRIWTPHSSPLQIGSHQIGRVFFPSFKKKSMFLFYKSGIDMRILQ